MEISSPVGLVMGAVAVLGTAMLKHLELSVMMSASATNIVVTGGFAACVTAYPMKDVVFSFKSLGLFFNGPGGDAHGIITEIERLAQLARKDGFLVLEKEVEKLQDPLLKKGIRMLADSVEPAQIIDTLESEIMHHYEEEEIAAKFWEDLGAFAPTVGILGAVLGLMVVMANLNNPDKIGPGIQTAFIATLYGVGLANLFALPAGKKIKRFCHQKKVFRTIILVGVSGIAGGTPPKALVERLRDMAGGGH